MRAEMTEDSVKQTAGGPGRILAQIMAFYDSRAVISAVELDVFTALARGPLTGSDLAEAVGVHPRGAADFFDALVALGLLERTGDTYANSPDADRYLVTGKPEFIGGYARMAGAMLFPLWGKLTEALRTGHEQVASERGMFDGYRDEQTTRRFLGAMDAVNAAVGSAMAELPLWEKYSSIVDLGGSRGNLAATLVRAHPHLEATSFDLPPVEPFFTEHVERLGLTGRVRFAAGDFFADPIPTADVFIAGHVLHFFGPEQRERLLARVFEGLKPGGALVVYDRMIDPERRTAALSLLGSLNMLLTSAGGREYTSAELADWLSAAGFATTEVAGVCPPDTLVIGYKN